MKSVVALLVGALLVFVLIVCVSVTTLLLARAAARQQEIAVRVALGAGRLRLLRMLLTESLLLAAVAGLASVALAWGMPALLNDWLTTARGGSANVWYSQAPDWRVFGYLALATLLAGVMAGLTPALQSLKVNLSEMLKGRQSLPSGGKGARLYGLLIGTQIALSLFLMAVAVLAVRTAQKAIHFAPGFETRQVLAVSQMVAFNRGERPAGAFHRTLTERISALPGVQSIAWSYWSPLFAGRARMDVQLPDRSLRRVAFNTVSANYFAALDIPLVSGRAFREDDPHCDTGRCFAVVSERLARAFWPNEVPLGKTFQLPQGAAYEVIGVARDISSTTLGGPDEPLFYQLWNPDSNYPANAFVRFAGEEAAVTHAVLKAYRDVAPDVPVEAETLQTSRAYSLEYIGKVSRLVTFICVLAVLLAVISIYGVVAFAVSRRTKELGIRLALGARPANIYRAVLGASGRPVAIGLTLGLALTLAAFSALAPLVRNIPFVVNVWEPFIFISAVLLLALAALAAMIGPARRATNIDPMVALRQE